MSNPFDSSSGQIVRVNLTLCSSFGFLFFGYEFWPERMVDYGWGFLSICLLGAGLGLLNKAIDLMRKLHIYDGGQKEFMAKGSEVKSSKLSSKSFLTKKGVIRNDK